MNKQQKLTNIPDGLLAGLVAIGFTSPWRWATQECEGASYRAWRSWSPANDTKTFRTFKVGGSADGRTSQARDILFAVNSTAPFNGYNRGPPNSFPRGLTPEEYLEDSVEGATPQERMGLARAFLTEMNEPQQK